MGSEKGMTHFRAVRRWSFRCVRRAYIDILYIVHSSCMHEYVDMTRQYAVIISRAFAKISKLSVLTNDAECIEQCLVIPAALTDLQQEANRKHPPTSIHTPKFFKQK